MSCLRGLLRALWQDDEIMRVEDHELRVELTGKAACGFPDFETILSFAFLSMAARCSPHACERGREGLSRVHGGKATDWFAPCPSNSRDFLDEAVGSLQLPDSN